MRTNEKRGNESAAPSICLVIIRPLEFLHDRPAKRVRIFCLSGSLRLKKTGSRKKQFYPFLFEKGIKVVKEKTLIYRWPTKYADTRNREKSFEFVKDEKH